jgi:hypothetical protein
MLAGEQSEGERRPTAGAPVPTSFASGRPRGIEQGRTGQRAAYPLAGRLDSRVEPTIGVRETLTNGAGCIVEAPGRSAWQLVVATLFGIPLRWPL